MNGFEPFTVDTGHSFWKLFWKNKHYIIPALVTSGPLRDQANGAFEVERSAESIDNIAVQTPFGLRYVGNLAKESTTPPWAAFDRGKYSRPEFLLPMLLGSMSEAKVSGETVVLVTAVPGEWAKDETLKKQIESHFLAEHVISREGKRGEKVVNICRVEVLSETGGLLYSHLLDSDGNLAVEDYQDLKIAVIDIGEHTTCVDIFTGLNREGKTRSYTDLSMGQINETISRRIAAEAGRHLDPWQVRDVVMGDGYILYNDSKGRVKRFDVMPLYDEEANKSKDLLYSIAGQTIKNARDINHILIGGGGSEALGSVLTDVYPQAKICGQFATSQGLHNYGRRLCNALMKR